MVDDQDPKQALPTSDVADEPGSASEGFGRQLDRRLLLALSAGAATLVGSGGVALAETGLRLAAYLKVGIKVSVFESEMRKELPGVKPTFLGRLRDFREAATDRGTQIVLAPGPVLEEVGLKPSLQGMKDGAAVEGYALVSVGQAMDPSDAPQRTIGMVDLVGRRKASELVEKMLGGHSPKKVKRVTKEADLLGLLQFAVADAIIVREASLERLRSGSQMKLVTTALPKGRLGLPAFWFSDDSVKSKVEPRVKEFSSNLLKMLGVDGWR